MISGAFQSIAGKIRRDALRRKIVRQGFWFVDVPRTGSTSLKLQLFERFGPPFGKSDGAFDGAGLNLRDHKSAQEMRELLGSDWLQVWSFSFVRNPWDRMLSLYRFRKEGLKDFGEEVTFEAFIHSLRKPSYSFTTRGSAFSRRVSCWNASDYLVDANGLLMVTEVFLFEERIQAFEKIAERLKVPLDSNSRVYPTGSSGYQSFYTAEMRDIVADHAWKDIELFGYEF